MSAQDKTRTCTSLRTPAPQAGVSTNFTTWAFMYKRTFAEGLILLFPDSVSATVYNQTYVLIKAGAKIVFLLNDKQVKNKYFNIIIYHLHIPCRDCTESQIEYLYPCDYLSFTISFWGPLLKIVMIFQKNVAVRFNFANFDIRT